MMRSVVYKKNATTAVLLALMAILILLVYPLRVLKETHVFPGSGAVTRISDAVDRDHDAGGTFTASYAHLDHLDIYVESLEDCVQIEVRLFEPKEDGSFPMLAQQPVLIGEGEVPGFVSAEMDVDLVPGRDYVVTINCKYGSARIGFEEASDVPPSAEGKGPAAPVCRSAFYNDSTVDGAALAMAAHYRMPITKGKTGLVILGILAFFAVLIRLVREWFDRNPSRNRLTSADAVLRVTLTPVASVLYAAALIMIIPMKMFDDRLPDILTYTIGATVVFLVVIYALWHDRAGVPDFMTTEKLRTSWRHYLIMVTVALIFHYCCQYMNGLYNIHHFLSARRMLIAFDVMLLLTFKLSDLVTVAGNVWLAVSSAASVIWYFTHRLGPDVKEYDLNNQVLAMTLILIVLTGRIVIALLQKYAFVRYSSREKKAPASILYATLAAVFSAAAILLRGGRWWIVVLIAFYLLFYLRYMCWEERDLWLEDLSRGICLHFMCAVAWCLMHRYYLSFNYTRFAMSSHTVTITAVYLTAVLAAITTRVVRKLNMTTDVPRGRKLCFQWREFTLFGTAGSYLLMTMSRTGVFAAAVMIAAVLALSCAYLRPGFVKGLGIFVQRAAVLVLSVVILLPGVFTLQRILPPMFDQPVMSELETWPERVLRGNHWDSHYYMCVERFVQVFGDKLFGIPEKEYSYFDEEHSRTHREEEEAMILAHEIEQSSIVYTPDDGNGGEGGGAGAGGSGAPQEDYTNGRVDIWRAYLGDMNMTGHDHMGATLPDGSVQVHAHNTFLQVMYDHGIAAGAVFLLFLAMTLIRAAMYYNSRRCGADSFDILPFAAIFAFGMTGLVEWVFHLCNPMTALLLLAVAPLFVRFEKHTKTE